MTSPDQSERATQNRDGRPTCWIIAGPNGAGKTTFALEYLPRIAGCKTFVNADLIATGLAPLAPERRRVAAGRVFLREIARNIAARHDFGFETTLAGRTHRRLILRLKSEGWWVELIYLALPTVEVAKYRVAERVRGGGHDIPLADIERRFYRSMENFLNKYAFLVDRAVCYFNSGTSPRKVFTQHGEHREIMEPTILRMLEKSLENRRRHGLPG